jgi:hypothetical protein
MLPIRRRPCVPGSSVCAWLLAVASGVYLPGCGAPAVPVAVIFARAPGAVKTIDVSTARIEAGNIVPGRFEIDAPVGWNDRINLSGEIELEDHSQGPAPVLVHVVRPQPNGRSLICQSAVVESQWAGDRRVRYLLYFRPPSDPGRYQVEISYLLVEGGNGRQAIVAQGELDVN